MALTKATYSMIDGAVANVNDFGAVNDGVTDNRAAFAAAFASGAKSIFVPAGTYKIVGDTLTIPDNVEFYGAGKYATTINFTPNGDKDCFVVGWYTTLRDMKIVDQYASPGNYGTLRLQSLTNPEIPTNVGGNDWRDPAIGGLSYKNTLRNLVLEGGHNYNIYMVNVGYITVDNVRAVLGRNTSANLYIWGKGGVNMPASTSVKIYGGEFTASLLGSGIAMENTYACVLTGVICEGNYGRGILMTDCSQIEIISPYVENNFALGAPTGDGDIVSVNGTQIYIHGGYILGNNSNDAVAASGSTACSLAGTAKKVLGGGEHTVSLDDGWTYTNWGMGPYGTGVQSNGRWAQYADGTAVYSKIVTFSGAITTATGSLFSSAPQIDTDFPAIFMSDGASGFYFSTAIHVVADIAGVIVSCVGGSTLNNAIRYALLCTTSQSTVNAKVYITLTGRWK